MDRPDGRIFYKDTLGTHAAGGDPWYLDNVACFDSTFGDDNGEAESADLVKLMMTSESVSATTRKLRAYWSIEVEQDLRAYHNLEVANEVVTDIADQIARKINQRALSLMLDASDDRELTFGMSSRAPTLARRTGMTSFWASSTSPVTKSSTSVTVRARSSSAMRSRLAASVAE
jgi:hypothetical protein